MQRLHLRILASHPIQYHAPWFRGLAKEIGLQVFFAHHPTAKEQATGFGGAFEWDVDLLSGYEHTFLKNKARRPGVNHFLGCDCPQIRELICDRDHKSQVRGQRTDNRELNNRELITDKGRRRRYDAFVVTGWNLKCYWQAIRACRRVGIPVLVRGDSQLDPTQPWFKRAAKQITHRLILRQFDGFLSPGKRNREYLLHYGVPEQKIFFVPHFVDNERFAAQAESIRGQRSQIRRQWKIPEDAFVPLFVGKFIPKKRPLDSVTAAQLLLRSHSELKLHLLFVGSGGLGAKLRTDCNVVFDAELVQKSQVRNHNSEQADRPPLTSETKPSASFAGFLNQTQVSSAYVAADVLVLPSESSETWGLVVNEAMASGLPVIVSDAVGCAPDLIDNGKTGFVFEVRNPVQLAERLAAIDSLENNSHDFQGALAEKMRAYNLEKAVSETLKVIRTLAVQCRDPS